MTATNTTETQVLELIMTADAWANIADNAGTSPLTNLYISLHTADPGEAGSQTTSEAAYTNYARVAVARSGSGWTVTGDSCTNDAAITFPTCGVTGATITHFGIGSAVSGAGVLYFYGTASLSVTNGVTPEFAAGALTVTAA
ncbi:MAG: hypothetical protein KTR33_13910 [Gammaproteobacteria bacterium]|nr:hypothetical protein [Gammaproteobacteria bacterium]